MGGVDTPRPLRWPAVVAVLAAAAALLGFAASRGEDVGLAVAAGAELAQRSCYGRIHHDTYAFERCVRELLGASALSSTSSPARALGIAYFGYVGAMNSARLGMLGAEDSANEFLLRFRAQQRTLAIDDRALCRSVPGDCEVRIARIRVMEAEAPGRIGRAARDASEEEQHVH